MSGRVRVAGGPYIKTHHTSGAPIMQSHRLIGHSRESANRPTWWQKLVLLIFGGLILSALRPLSVSAEEQHMKKENLAWFKNPHCERIEIREFKRISNAEPSRTSVVTDRKTIDQVIRAIQALPVAGEIMVSFAASASYTRLDFKCSGQVDTVEFYNDKIKTPDTSFFVADQKFERPVFLLVEMLLRG